MPAGRPVVPLFGSVLFPARLWIYTNFDCNLACAYCSVASSPQAPRRRLGPERFAALVDEAVAAGVDEVYVTGGEPFLEHDLVDMLLYASERLEVVCLTNGMLYRGRRRRELERLAGRAGLTLQTSLDGTEAAHDAQRGRGILGAGAGGCRRRALARPSGAGGHDRDQRERRAGGRRCARCWSITGWRPTTWRSGRSWPGATRSTG